jgi:predicted  nucleic acid-binding Zn-ribbon protein
VLLAKGTYARDDITLVEGLENEVQALKSRCNTLEKTVKDLQSICDTNQRYIETFRQQIIGIQRDLGTLDSSYQGEEFEVMQ